MQESGKVVANTVFGGGSIAFMQSNSHAECLSHMNYVPFLDRIAFTAWDSIWLYRDLTDVLSMLVGAAVLINITFSLFRTRI